MSVSMIAPTPHPIFFDTHLYLNLEGYGPVLEVISPMIIGKIGYVHVGMSLDLIYTTDIWMKRYTRRKWDLTA